MCACSVMSDSATTDCSPPCSSVHGTAQARTLEWVTRSSSSGYFSTQGLKLHLWCLLHCQQILYHCVTWKALINCAAQAK